MGYIGIYQVSAHSQELLSDYLKKRHNVTKLVVHLVLITKYRRKLFERTMIQQLREALESLCEKLECKLLEIDGERDHAHLPVSYPPKLAVSVMINNLKAEGSRRLRILNTYLTVQSKSGMLWSRSYFACSSSGATIETLKEYVNSQSTSVYKCNALSACIPARLGEVDKDFANKNPNPFTLRCIQLNNR